jgi:hypothetical protein
MITGLLIFALLLTALLAASLPFNGWGSGMDAAGKGMAMFFPFIFMTLRAASFMIAIVVLASRGDFAWSALPALAAGAIAVLIVAGMGVSSLTAASLLTESPGSYGRGTYAFLAVIVGPAVLAIWLFSEAYDVDEPQDWVMRALVPLAALGPLPLLLAINRHSAEMRALAGAQEKADEAAAAAYAAQLPDSASFLEALAFLDGMPEDQWCARGLVMDRIQSMPDREASFLQGLMSSNWDDRVRVAFHATALSPQTPPAYFEAAREIVETVVGHLREGTLPMDQLVRETAAAIRIAWPAIHRDDLPRALMSDLHEAIQARAAETPLNAYIHDAKMLADYVNG